MLDAPAPPAGRDVAKRLFGDAPRLDHDLKLGERASVGEFEKGYPLTIATGLDPAVRRDGGADGLFKDVADISAGFDHGVCLF